MNNHNVPNTVTNEMIESALDFLIAIEPDPELVLEMDEYDEIMKKYTTDIEEAHLLIKKYAEQIEPNTLEAMQDRYYSFTNADKYLQSAIHSSVVCSTLGSCWNGVGPWRT